MLLVVMIAYFIKQNHPPEDIKADFLYLLQRNVIFAIIFPRGDFMGLFDAFKEKERTYICSCCQKEIPRSESFKIGGYDYCKDCVAKYLVNVVSINVPAGKHRYYEAKAVSKIISKRYYYIFSNYSPNNIDIVTMLFLSRDRRTLLYIETTLYQENVKILIDKTSPIPLKITEESLRELILSDFGFKIEKMHIKKILQIIESRIGYEYISVLRLERLFLIHEEPWKKTTWVGYDKVTKKPYLIDFSVFDNGGTVTSATYISFEAVSKYAKNKEKTSEFAIATEENRETFIKKDTIQTDESTTYDGIYQDNLCVFLTFKEIDGERFPIY